MRKINPIIKPEINIPTNKSANACQFNGNPRLLIDRRSSHRLAMNTERVIAAKVINWANKEKTSKLSPFHKTAGIANTNDKRKNKMLCPNRRHPARKRLSPGDMNKR
jgi:hypothetical protein